MIVLESLQNFSKNNACFPGHVVKAEMVMLTTVTRRDLKLKFSVVL